MINGKIVNLTEQEIREYYDKEEEIKKAKEEARLNAISKTEVIKIVREEAKKLGIHPKEAITTKTGELFKKAQEAEHEALNIQHTEKGNHSKEEKYSGKGLDEFSKSKEENKSTWNLSLKQESMDWNEIELSLENVPFVINMVIKELEYGIFFTDEFGDQAFQRWSDIDKEGMEALVSYLVVASMAKSLKNARFSMKLRKLIAEHLGQEKLKSKKVKLEALGSNMD
nr:hypothetical protein [Tanacetum cinerariifolium]